MKRATDLQKGAGAAVEGLAGLSDPIEVAFVVASVMHGLKNPYALDFVAELRDRVNGVGQEQEVG